MLEKIRFLLSAAVLAQVLLFGIDCVSAENANISIDYLRCENRVEPLGIDITSPRLSWILNSDQRGQKQTAYRVLVASDEKVLAKNTGDLWDSGKVNSEKTNTIYYEGKELATGMNCFWKVMIWDADGNASGWSEPAKWTMGMLDSQDWQGKWIGYDSPDTVERTPVAMTKAMWIWDRADSIVAAEPGEVYFRKEYDIKDLNDVESIMCYATADDYCELYINGSRVVLGTGFDRGHSRLYELEVELSTFARKNIIAIMARNNGNSPNPAGLIFAMDIVKKDGSHEYVVSDGSWITSAEPGDNWTSAGYNDSSWDKAYALMSFGSQPWPNTTTKFLPPVRYLRGDCKISNKKIKSAYLSASALGIYELFLNGKRVSDDYFSPGWTDYKKRTYYRTYDVTEYLKSGENTIGTELADGWYSGYVGYARERYHYGKMLRFICQLNVEYADGTTEVFGSGPDWKASEGPLKYADFLMGEYYDARKEATGWNKPGFDDSSWSNVAVGCVEFVPPLQAAVSPPVRVYAEVKPISISEPVDGKYIIDMGQNFAGFVRLKVKGEKGQKITLRHAEWLNPDGTIYTVNLRSAVATDTYICKGEGVEIWQPYFTFHGFQYVEISGLDEKPSLDVVTGLAVSSDTPIAGTFKCSDPMVNKIQQNALWTQRMNFIDVPTDCPQRDERLGWTGDAQVYINTACYHTDVQAFFKKWVTDLVDSQRGDGQFPMVAPLIVAESDGGPAWADAGVICPWTIYKMYGDKETLASSYEAMKKFIEFCKNRSTDELLPPDRFHCFGDWLNINDNTPTEVIFTSYFAYSTHLTAKAAEVLGHSEDASYYYDLFEKIKAAYKSAYVDDEGKIRGDTQSAYVMAIAYELLDGEDAKLAADHLVRRISECDWHLSTGFIGTKDLMLALAKIGRNDIAYRLLFNDTFPSWGFSIKQGATSIWERWNGWTPEGGFNDPGMNSFAHYSFGAVCQWIFENIGGIQTDGPAFDKIIIKPEPNEKLTWAETSYKSVHGKIETFWKTENGDFLCNVKVPAGTTARVYIIADDVDGVSESGKKISKAAGVKFINYDGKFAIFDVVSGSYSFKSSM